MLLLSRHVYITNCNCGIFLEANSHFLFIAMNLKHSFFCILAFDDSLTNLWCLLLVNIIDYECFNLQLPIVD